MARALPLERECHGFLLSLLNSYLLTPTPHRYLEHGRTTDSGSLYIFERAADHEWAQMGGRLFGASMSTSSYLGHTIAMSGDGNYVLGGAHGFDSPGAADAGAAYLFHYNGSSWSEQHHFLNPRPQTNTYMGHRNLGLTYGADFAVISARDDNKHGVDTGAVWVYRRDGTSWEIATELTMPQYSNSIRFGQAAISPDGGTVVVGAYSDSNGGTVHVFKREAADWSDWSRLAVLGRSGDATSTTLGISVRVTSNGAWVIAGASGSDESVFSYQMGPAPAGDWACPADSLHVIRALADPAKYTCSVPAGDVSFQTPAEVDCSAAANGVAQVGGIASGAAFPVGLTTNQWEAPNGSYACTSHVRVLRALRLRKVRDTDEAAFARTVRLSGDGRVAAVAAHADDDQTTNSG